MRVKHMMASVMGASFALAGCVGTPPPGRHPLTADAAATRETKALLASLGRIAPKATLFGHQDTLAYGYRWRGERDRSDVKDVAGCF